MGAAKACSINATHNKGGTGTVRSAFHNVLRLMTDGVLMTDGCPNCACETEVSDWQCHEDKV